MLITLAICSLLHSSVFAFTPSVTYVSFLATNSSYHDVDMSAIIRSEVLITDSDDSPIIEVKLPVVFPYFGDFIDRVFVSPNGYVQTFAAALTSPYFSSPCTIAFDGVIAGYLTDLTTHTPSHPSSVSVLQTNEVTSIRYRKLNVWGYVNVTDPQFDFDINLHSDGTVILNYIQVTPLKDVDPSKVKKCSWLTGLASSNYTTATGRAEITTEQLQIQTNVWEALLQGVYPAVREDVASGSRFIACPVSTAWCATPATIGPSTDYINITTLSIGCIQRQYEDINSTIDIAVQIESRSTSSFSINISRIAPCVPLLSAEPLTSAPVAFQCNITRISFSSFAGAGDMSLYVLWKPAVDGHTAGSYTALDETVPTVNLSFTNTPPSITSCSLNQAMGSCFPCDVCNSHVDPLSLTCLSLTCPVNTQYVTNASFESFSSSANLQSLYASPSCSKSCANTFVEQFDKFSVCCAVEDIDCWGVCNGGALGGVTELGDEGYGVCCKSTSPPDCQGVCGGEAVVDTCNVCNGNDSGVLCPTGIEVDTGENVLNSNRHLATSYDALNSSYTSLVHVTVSNIFNTSVYVTIMEVPKEIKSGLVFGPVFQLVEGLFEVPENASYTFDIFSNMSGLFSGELKGWEVKTLSIRFQRPSQFDSFLAYDIDVLPASFNCEEQESLDLCIGLPGCMHCLWLDGDIRILQAVPEDEEEGNLELELVDPQSSAYDYYYPTKRKLYPQILPDFAGIDDYESDNGFCVAGFGNTACPFENSAASVASGGCLVLLLVAVLAVTIVLL